MKYAKQVGTVLLILGASLFYMGLRVKQYNLYLLVPGGILALIGFVAVTFINKKQENTFLDEYNRWKQKLISTGLRIDVDLSKVEVKSNAYREEIEVEVPRHHLMAFELLTDRDNRVFDNVVQSVVVFEANVLGAQRKFYSPMIPKDNTTLLVLLDMQKQTSLYVDREDQKNYFFDFEFLRG